MKREKNISRKVALNLWLPIIVVVFILVAALGVIEVNPGLGYTILVGDVIYLIASVLCYEYTEKMINNELLTAGFEQSQIQKQILKELPVPYVMTDQSGTIIWYNKQFSEIAGQKIIKKSITQIFPGLIWNVEKRKRFRMMGLKETFFRYFTFLMRRSFVDMRKSRRRRVWLPD